MNYFREMHFILLIIIISNVIIVFTTQNAENQVTITTDDMDKLIRDYPAFIKMTLQNNEYYTGKDVSHCSMPDDENTTIDDSDIEQYKVSNLRESIIGQRLGNIIKPCLKDNTQITQCYTHYLNVIESVGLTLVDRYCLFEYEVWNRLQDLEFSVDYIENYSLFNIDINIPLLFSIVKKFVTLLENISFTFKQYGISTIPLDCVSDAMDCMPLYFQEGMCEDEKFKHHLQTCRALMKSKLNYAALDNDQHWEWDITSDSKPNDNSIILIQQTNNDIGLNLFPYNN
ncbi:uncharacterized protein LOC126904764 [Daktulosphaira vitifoliae]|uniref:uncharacterized protein LOC126904764 n=1 Tax=Daktulosphaira vitifoliae TaxID=58002 RepID=UPI0021A9F50B|nr:uncharacterized protein LOC126904764 [Daktulosphaira vitifoliae]XP_050539943.1 uncharacterized protein LOC126904764 [Daktulosphaira vitifoliae]